jgi:hypothetical protein
MKVMEENANLLETLLERASEYGKTSIELASLYFSIIYAKKRRTQRSTPKGRIIINRNYTKNSNPRLPEFYIGKPGIVICH